MLRDDRGNVAYSKVIVFGTFAVLLVSFVAVGVLIALEGPDADVWDRFEGWMQWGSSAFLGSSTIFHIGHRATHRASGDR